MSSTRSGPIRSQVARNAVLEAAAAILAERGYQRLTIEGIAARAGVGKQTIYRWWDSKGAIIAECLLEGRLYDYDIPDTGDVMADVVSWVRGVFASLREDGMHDILRSLIAAASDNAEVGDRLRHRFIGADGLSGRLARGVGETARLTADAPLEQLSEALIGAIMVRALSRSDLTDADADRLVLALIG